MMHQNGIKAARQVLEHLHLGGEEVGVLLLAARPLRSLPVGGVVDDGQRHHLALWP